ncbi:MAG: hypothetical protein WCJ33_05995 [Pseudomonadota bacterium]
MKKSTVIVPKASSYNFDNTTMYNLQEKLEINLITEKFNRSLRPIPTNSKAIPIPKPNKDTLDIDHPGAEVVRSDINPTKKIPHKDYIPKYVPPYYTIKETGHRGMDYNNIFRRGT